MIHHIITGIEVGRSKEEEFNNFFFLNIVCVYPWLVVFYECMCLLLCGRCMNFDAFLIPRYEIKCIVVQIKCRMLCLKFDEFCLLEPSMYFLYKFVEAIDATYCPPLISYHFNNATLIWLKLGNKLSNCASVLFLY